MERGQAPVSGVIFCGPNPFTGFGPNQGVFGLIQGTPRVALSGVLAPELFLPGRKFSNSVTLYDRRGQKVLLEDMERITSNCYSDP